MIETIRQKYPQYSDLSDQDLADKLYAANYSDLPKEEFYNKIGLKVDKPSALGRIGAAAEGYAQGMFTPFVDEFVTDPIAALASGAILGKNPVDQYKLARQETEARQEKNKDLYPVTSGASNLTGALGGAGILGGTAIGKGIDTALRPVAQKGLLRAGEQIARGGILGAAAGAAQGAGEAKGGERLQGAGQGATLGGILGAGAGTVGSVVSGVKKGLQPDFDPFTARLAQKAQQYGIKIPADVVSENEVLKSVGGVTKTVPLTGIKKLEKENVETWAKAVGKTIGLDDAINADGLAKAKKALGSRFNAIETGRAIPVTDDLLGGLNDIEYIAQNATTEDVGNVILKQVNKVKANIANKSEVPVETLATLRKEMNALAGKSKNYELASAFHDIEAFLSDKIIDSLPDVQRADYVDLKKQYRNFLTIKKAVKRDPEAALKSPSKLINAVSTVFKDFPEGGGGELADLARIGKLFVDPRAVGSNTVDKALAAGAALSVPAGILNPAIPAAAGGVMLGGRGVTSMLYNQEPINRAIQQAQGILPAPSTGALENIYKYGQKSMLGAN